MALANDAIRVTPGSGASLAHLNPGSATTKSTVRIVADPYGQVERQHYVVQLPPLHVNPDGYPWEVFNGLTSNLTLRLESVEVVRAYDVTGGTASASPRADLFRTTALSSGGTAFKIESTSTVSAQVGRLDLNDTAWPSTVTIKTRVTSITTGAHLGTMFMSRDTSVDKFSTLLPKPQQWTTRRQPTTGLTIRAGQGIAARTGTVGSSAVTFIWTLLLSAEP